jgi:hypothetical protein
MLFNIPAHINHSYSIYKSYRLGYFGIPGVIYPTEIKLESTMLSLDLKLFLFVTFLVLVQDFFSSITLTYRWLCCTHLKLAPKYN